MDVLVADDEPYIRRSLSFVLKKEGFEVETASNGEEAILKTRELKPRVIFLDIMMPRMNGFNVCRQIKADDQTRSCHVIILTAKGQELDREKGLREGADDYLTKPFSPREVVAKVRKVIGAPG